MYQAASSLGQCTRLLVASQQCSPCLCSHSLAGRKEAAEIRHCNQTPPPAASAVGLRDSDLAESAPESRAAKSESRQPACARPAVTRMLPVTRMKCQRPASSAIRVESGDRPVALPRRTVLSQGGEVKQKAGCPCPSRSSPGRTGPSESRPRPSPAATGECAVRRPAAAREPTGLPSSGPAGDRRCEHGHARGGRLGWRRTTPKSRMR